MALVFRGKKTRTNQPRAACRGPLREGAIINVRAIAGKNVEFLVNTKRDCANGKRANDLYIRMRIIAKAIARGEIMELATYYSGLTSQPGRGGLLQALKE